MTIGNRRKERLRLLLLGAAALASSSATLGGTLTVLALQHPSQSAAGSLA